MTSYIVAKRYATALLELGKEDGAMEKYGEELAAVASLFVESPELEAVLANPVFDAEDRGKVLATFMEKLDLSPMVRNFFRLLLDRGRIAATREISAVYASQQDEVKGVTRAEVTSAAPLSDEDVASLKEALASVAGRDVVLEFKQDADLIGGVVARIGDLVLDGSVKTQLDSLKESLRKGEVV